MFIGILCIESGCTQGSLDEVLELSTAGFTAFRHLVFHFSLALAAKWGPLHFSPGLELRMNLLLSGPQLPQIVCLCGCVRLKSGKGLTQFVPHKF